MTTTLSTPLDSRSDAPTLVAESSPDDSLDWCVDDSGRLTPMTELTLWAALTLGHVSTQARVWRLGMERWLPVEQVPELRLALPRRKTMTPRETQTREATTIPSAPPSLVAPFDAIFDDATTPAPVTVAEEHRRSRPTIAAPQASRLWRLLGALRRSLTPVTVGTAAMTVGLAFAASAALASPGRVAEARSLASTMASVREFSARCLATPTSREGDVAPQQALASPSERPKLVDPGQRRRRSSVR